MRAKDPLALFRKWYREAQAAGTLLPEAMALARPRGSGAPSVRMVLHRGFSRGGFVFFTNYNSRKAVELIENPRAAFAFHWPLLDRQVRGEGRVYQVVAERVGSILSEPSAREPVERVGVTAERGDSRIARFSKRNLRRRVTVCGAENTVSAVLGWLSNCDKLYRILAGTTASPA